MDVRVEKIITAFVENGWELVGILDVSQDWWFQDIILLESTWKPVGKKLYLTLGTDPAQIQKKVWCVNITSEMPENRNYIPFKQITLNDVKRTDLTALVKSINEIVLK